MLFFYNKLTVDPDVGDTFPTCTVKQLSRRFKYRNTGNFLEETAEEIGGFSCFQRADFPVPSQGFGASHGRGVQHFVYRGRRGVFGNSFGEEGGETCLTKHIEFVVARHSVSADAEIDSGIHDFSNRSKTACQFEVGAWAVADARPRFRECIDIAVRKMHGVN